MTEPRLQESDTEHVDLYAVNPLATGRRFLKRLSLDDPLLVKSDGRPTQLAEGLATYAEITAPHTMESCPERQW